MESLGKFENRNLDDPLPNLFQVNEHSQYLIYCLEEDSNLHATSFLKKRGILHRKPPLDLKDRCLLQPAMKLIAYYIKSTRVEWNSKDSTSLVAHVDVDL